MTKLSFLQSFDVGVSEFDQAIIDYVKGVFDFLIDMRTAEQICSKIGSPYSLEQELTLEIEGRANNGSSAKGSVGSTEIRDALQPPESKIMKCIRLALERCPQEYAGALLQQGIIISGVGALRGIERCTTYETGLPARTV